MNFIDRFLKTKAPFPPKEPMHEQAVLVYVEGEDLDESIPVQEELFALLENSDIGIFDGNEVGGGQLVLFLYGPDAEALFKFVEPTLRASEFCKGARVVIRWGQPGAPKRELTL